MAPVRDSGLGRGTGARFQKSMGPFNKGLSGNAIAPRPISLRTLLNFGTVPNRCRLRSELRLGLASVIDSFLIDRDHDYLISVNSAQTRQRPTQALRPRAIQQNHLVASDTI